MVSKGRRGVGGVTVSMVAFQAVYPGSTPGRRNFLLPMAVRLLRDQPHKMVCSGYLNILQGNILCRYQITFLGNIIN